MEITSTKNYDDLTVNFGTSDVCEYTKHTKIK